jgi:hypothetical protein
MSASILYLGVGVHKDSITLAAAGLLGAEQGDGAALAPEGRPRRASGRHRWSPWSSGGAVIVVISDRHFEEETRDELRDADGVVALSHPRNIPANAFCRLIGALAKAAEREGILDDRVKRAVYKRLRDAQVLHIPDPLQLARGSRRRQRFGTEAGVVRLLVGIEPAGPRVRNEPAPGDASTPRPRSIRSACDTP